LITSSLNTDLRRPTAWIKHPEPIFTCSNHVFGPDQQSFTKSADGLKDCIIYYSAQNNGSGSIRQICAQKFSWSTDSTPELGKTAN
jgi:GH43 family beta-xylosidase